MVVSWALYLSLAGGRSFPLWLIPGAPDIDWSSEQSPILFDNWSRDPSTMGASWHHCCEDDDDDDDMYGCVFATLVSVLSSLLGNTFARSVPSPTANNRRFGKIKVALGPRSLVLDSHMHLFLSR